MLTSANIFRACKLAADGGKDKICTIASVGMMASLFVNGTNQGQNQRQLWTHEWLLERKDLGAHHILLKTLKDEDPKIYMIS